VEVGDERVRFEAFDGQADFFEDGVLGLEFGGYLEAEDLVAGDVGFYGGVHAFDAVGAEPGGEQNIIKLIYLVHDPRS